MTQYFVIAVVVLWAVLYSAWSLMPAGWRRAAARRVATWAGRSPLGGEQARSLEATLLRTGGCSGCDSCNGCARATARPPAREPIL